MLAAILVILSAGCADKKSSPIQSSKPVTAPPAATNAMTNSPASVPAVTTNQTARLIVKWRVAPQTSEAVALRTKINATSIQVFQGVGDGRMEVVLLPDDRKCAEAIKALEASGLVEYAELDAKVKANKP